MLHIKPIENRSSDGHNYNDDNHTLWNTHSIINNAMIPLLSTSITNQYYRFAVLYISMIYSDGILYNFLIYRGSNLCNLLIYIVI